MKKKIAGVLFVLTVLAIATSIGFAYESPISDFVRSDEDSPVKPVNFTAKLYFGSEWDDHVTLELTNYGDAPIIVSSAAHYIDNAGSAGSKNCNAAAETTIRQKEKKRIAFQIEDPAAHGPDSILAFYFQYGGDWYLGKTGEINGVEFFRQHN